MAEIEVYPTASEYLLSNGTRVVSDTAVSFYSDGEIIKIYVAGAIAVIAVLILTYALYKWVTARYQRWAIQQELEERVARGENVNPEEYPMPEGVNRGLMLVVGGLVILAGIVLYLIPV